jgi:hypothetical protein
VGLANENACDAIYFGVIFPFVVDLLVSIF